MIYTSTSEKQTKQLAYDLIKKFSQKQQRGALRHSQDKALVFALSGQLGAGKTRFVQGGAEFFGIKRNITSPTFVLMKRYRISGRTFKDFYHFDCYRLDSPQDVLDLGWEKIIFDPRNIVFVEWAEKISDILPPDTICVTIKEKGQNKREVEVSTMAK